MKRNTNWDMSEPRPCAQCGELWTPDNYNRTVGKYCSSACKQKAYRERKKGDRPAAPAAPKVERRNTGKKPKGALKSQMPPWARWDKKARRIHRLRGGCKKGTRVHFGAARAVVKGGFADPCTACFPDFDQTVAKRVKRLQSLAGKYRPPT